MQEERNTENKFDSCIRFLKSLQKFNPKDVVKGTYVMNLDSIKALLNLLDNPQDKLSFVHVAGTNGKGSTCMFIASILKESGYTTGLFTSPYLTHLNEQICIDGVEISDKDAGEYLSIVIEKVEILRKEQSIFPSEFEIIVSAAFLYFVSKKCDIVVLEVGLGGDMDATNVISKSALSVITPISFDHTDILGDSYKSIASHKAGIIKKDGCVLIAPQNSEAQTVIKQKCKDMNAELITANMEHEVICQNMYGQEFVHPVFGTIKIKMAGDYQIENAIVAASAAAILGKKGFNKISGKSIALGLERALWPCRLEILGTNPVTIYDGSHNIQGIDMLCRNLRRLFPGKKIRFVVGFLQDKNYEKMALKLGEIAEKFYTVEPVSVRALSAKKLADFLIQSGYEAQAFAPSNDSLSSIEILSGKNVFEKDMPKKLVQYEKDGQVEGDPKYAMKKALQKAVSESQKNDIICVCGSFYFVGILKSM